MHVFCQSRNRMTLPISDPPFTIVVNNIIRVTHQTISVLKTNYQYAEPRVQKNVGWILKASSCVLTHHKSLPSSRTFTETPRDWDRGERPSDGNAVTIYMGRQTHRRSLTPLTPLTP